MKWLTIAVLFLIIGVGIGFWIASNRPKPKEVTMAFSDVGDLFLMADPKDVITWDQTGSGAKFKHKIPCVEGKPGDTIRTCTVTMKGVYLYNCDDKKSCPDPGIAIGTDVIMLNRKQDVSSITPADPRAAAIYCDDNKKAAADPIKSAPPESTFQFYGEGESFTVKFDPGTCEKGDLLTEKASVCTVLKGATNQPNYEITLTGCDKGTGSLKVM